MSIRKAKQFLAEAENFVDDETEFDEEIIEAAPRRKRPPKFYESPEQKYFNALSSKIYNSIPRLEAFDKVAANNARKLAERITQIAYGIGSDRVTVRPR